MQWWEQQLEHVIFDSFLVSKYIAIKYKIGIIPIVESK